MKEDKKNKSRIGVNIIIVIETHSLCSNIYSIPKACSANLTEKTNEKKNEIMLTRKGVSPKSSSIENHKGKRRKQTTA